MKILLSYFTMILLLFLISCEEDRVNEPCSGNCITITGKVTTEHNSAVVAEGVELKLSWGKPITSPTITLGTNRNIATTTSDEKGFYQFKFTPKSNELRDGSYKICFSKKGFFTSQENFFDISRGDTIVHQNIHIARKGKVRVKILDFPINSSDHQIYISPFYSTYKTPGLGTISYDLQGQAISPNTPNTLEFTSEVAANQYTYFDILRIVNGHKQFEKDSIFNNAGQETIYSYKY